LSAHAPPPHSVRPSVRPSSPRSDAHAQDLFLRSAALIQSLLVEGNAHLYVCGDGRSMAADVHRELVAVLQAGAKPAARNAVEAEAILSRLAKAGRYTREIWYG
jgi:sulfite reductase alpha subunit-like flavoprotein